MKWKYTPWGEVKTGFALLPVWCEDGVCVWLRRFYYIEHRQYTHYCGSFSTRESADNARRSIESTPLTTAEARR